jgi:NTP pyrophosphatase (non-canonical NTP hydrolase)
MTMDEKTYVAHVRELASNQYHDTLVPPCDLNDLFGLVKEITYFADMVKRALFYGKAYAPEDENPAYDGNIRHRPEHADLVHGILGLFTEAGELMEALGKVLRGAELDRINLIEEMGDAHWYLALLSYVAECSLSDFWEFNMMKLRKRYPDKFTEHNAEHRDPTAERKVLEQAVSGDFLPDQAF